MFEIISGTGNFVFLQNSLHGGTPIAQFHSSTKWCTLYCDCSILSFYNKPPIDTLISTINDNIYIKTQIDTLFSNIALINYHTKTEIDDLDNGLPTLVLNTYNKSDIDTFSTGYYNIEYLNTHICLKATSSNTYTKSEVDNITNPLDVPSMSIVINNNGTSIIYIYIYIYIYWIPDIQKQKLILLYQLLMITQKLIIC